MSTLRQRAKIPGPDTGIEIRHTLCDICTPQMHCGLDVYVKDGQVLKVEGSPDHPVNRGYLCTKGACNRQYLYREDRVLTPLRRTGPRGSGSFEPISWEEALDEISRRLLAAREQRGPEHVAFFSGYGKWYRPMFRRFAHAFGTQNYGTESSCCFTSGLMAWQVATGMHVNAEMEHSDLFLGWGTNAYYSRYRIPGHIERRCKEGMKVIIVDPRLTPANQRLADLLLRPRLGTDGALALSIACELIRNGWVDLPYIQRYVYGYEEYRAYAETFPPERGEALTGVPAHQIRAAARMIHESSSMSICESSAPIGHHRNGLQNYRAIMALLAITGNYDREGGQLPATHAYMEISSGFETHEEEYMEANFPQNAPPAVGADRFPLWYELRREMQANDLANAILSPEADRRVDTLFALGMNYRMFAGDRRMEEALRALDFFVDVDLFLTDTAKYADLVLPACTSLERGEFKCYPNGYLWYTRPVVAPLGQAKPDTEILTLLARNMGLGDPLLEEGYEAGIRWMIRDLPVTVEELQASPAPVRLEVPPYRRHGHLDAGLPTPTGKFELKSALIESHPEWGLDALPTYTPPVHPQPERWPYTLCAGTRIPNAIHSRLHDVPWARSLRPRPACELSLEDARKLGVEEGDTLEVATPFGALQVQAMPTKTVQDGEVYLFHGYREADANSILDPDGLDPYSGFPAYRSAYCTLRRIDP